MGIELRSVLDIYQRNSLIDYFREWGEKLLLKVEGFAEHFRIGIDLMLWTKIDKSTKIPFLLNLVLIFFMTNNFINVGQWAVAKYFILIYFEENIIKKRKNSIIKSEVVLIEVILFHGSGRLFSHHSLSEVMDCVSLGFFTADRFSIVRADGWCYIPAKVSLSHSAAFLLWTVRR